MTEVKMIGGFNSIDDKEIWFYGAHDKDERPNNVNETVSNEAQQNPKRSLLEDSLGCFVIYKRQNDALAKCEEEGPMARVFAFEYSVHHPGQRQYLVSTVERFWKWYRSQCGVSFYELIPQNCPAHLYFDLEFYREANPDVEEKKLIKDFNDCVSEVFEEVFGIDLNPEKDMLVLDASTTTKFSEHIIVHLADNYLFPSNTSMKSFIQQLREKMLSSGRCLVWNASATKLVTLFDGTVYSVNRNFRLYLSSKLGKNNPLVLAQRCNFYAQKKRCSKQIFLDSLVVPVKYNTPKILHIPTIENGRYRDIRSREPKILAVSAQVPLSNENMDCITGYGTTSPFPVLEQHIIAINRRWKDNASIRQWKLSVDKFKTSRHIIYYITNCRYCFNIGREHRSNGTYWVVDLDKLHCFQKCFDVDCNGTSSNYFPLPNFVCSSLLSTKEPTFVDSTLEANETAIQIPNTEAEDGRAERGSMSKQLLLDVIKESRAMNETEVEKRTLTTRNEIASAGVRKLQKSQNLFELTDDELLNAFASVKN
ncbi:unnamed protein product [Litomosoides sigmodontis]|uniref:DNA-directed primase/polymerase protein n=1 Tax=Litomosoides sigmodontis TaxID=42156 RepID=A0A3P6V330_LITSI|nr:unnamed protein product [Litomosoides sigmodontis]